MDTTRDKETVKDINIKLEGRLRRTVEDNLMSRGVCQSKADCKGPDRYVPGDMVIELLRPLLLVEHCQFFHQSPRPVTIP